MIITITGKPCSGKGTISKEFCATYNFEYVCTGDMFRAYAQEFGYDDILKFQEDSSLVKIVDKMVDNKILQIGQQRLNENIVIDSRLAWHFIPNSFKVFIDVNPIVAGERLLNANRVTEKTATLESAIQKLESRWIVENERYMELYKTNNLNLNNYDFVVDSSNKTPTEVMQLIFNAYQEFLKKS